MKSLLAAALVALALPAAAAAHATLVRTVPADGAVLERAPAAVRVVFDDTVTRGPGIAAIRNGGGSVLAGTAHVSGGRTLVVPLRRGLGKGAYTVRWAIVSDDGHLESGVVAFAVGHGAAPVAALGAEATGPRAPDVVARWLFLLGVLGSVGVACAVLLARLESANVPLVLATASVLAALGAAEEASRVGLDTRAGTALVAGSVAAVVVAVLAAAATLQPRVLVPSLLCALPLAVVPTVSGHALDHGLPRINVVADLAHVVGAAVWVGALVAAVVLRRVSFRFALVGVVLLAATGVVRAWYELLHVSQLWDIAYGRILLVKTGILLAALAIGLWRRRYVELVVAAGLIVAVSFLVLERPGRNTPPAARAAAVAREPSPEPPAPPAGALVLAHESGVYGVALAVEPRRQTVTVLSPAGGGTSGLRVTVDGRAAEPCGSGCYRVEAARKTRVAVAVDGVISTFTVPRHTPGAAALVARLGRRFRAFTSVEYVELLASGPQHGIVARWRLERPDRLSYSIANGAQAIVIGARRWDRATPRGRWQQSSQTPPLRQPAPQWARATNAHLLGEGVVAFADPTTPAYFTVHFDPKTLRPTLLEMTAASHFMSDGYVRFDSGRRLHPPR